MKYIHLLALIFFTFTTVTFADVVPPHPIDVAFEGKLEFMGTNYEMIKNIELASIAWREEIERQEAKLLDVLAVTQREQFKVAQAKWNASFKADREFFFANPAYIRSAIGREGQIGESLRFMQRIRERALLLQEWAQLFQPSDITN